MNSNAYRKATEVYDRYLGNVERYLGGSSLTNGKFNDLADVQVPRRVYMGLSNG